MDTLTGIERATNILQRKPVDRIGLFEHFWGDTEKEWRAEGHLAEDESPADRFAYDFDLFWPLNMTAKIDFVPQIVEETEETRLVRVLYGNDRAVIEEELLSKIPIVKKTTVTCSTPTIPSPIRSNTTRTGTLWSAGSSWGATRPLT